MMHTNTTTFSSDRYILSKTVVFQAGIKENRYTYTAREWDAESANYYYRARYYTPTAGRFTARDPIEYEDEANLYEYVDNNPLILVDPSGKNREYYYSNHVLPNRSHCFCSMTSSKDWELIYHVCMPAKYTESETDVRNRYFKAKCWATKKEALNRCDEISWSSVVAERREQRGYEEGGCVPTYFPQKTCVEYQVTFYVFALEATRYQDYYPSLGKHCCKPNFGLVEHSISNCK